MDNRKTLFSRLLSNHHTLMWRLCRSRSGGDSEYCKDLLQEVYIDLWRNLDKLRPDATKRQERAWVGWQARSTLYRIGRKERMVTEPLTEEMAETIGADNEHREVLESCLEALSDDERLMIKYYLDGYSAKEIGQQIGASRDTVYQRMHRAIKKMRHTVLIILFLVVVACAAAIGFAPRLGRFLGFGGGKMTADTIAEGKATSSLADTVVLDTISENGNQRHMRRHSGVELEKLPPLSVTDYSFQPDTVWMSAPVNQLTVSVDDSRLIITGKTGESIRVYNSSGKLLGAGTADGLCIIDLNPNNDPLYYVRKYQYRLMIGSREELIIQM